MTIKPTNNYFSGFQQLRKFSTNKPATNAFALLKILSYFTVVIPVVVGIAYGIAALKGRIQRPYSDPQSDRTQEAANLILTEYRPQSASTSIPADPITLDKNQILRDLKSWAKQEKNNGVSKKHVTDATKRIKRCLLHQEVSLELYELKLKTFF